MARLAMASEGRWNGKAIPIMDELVQMAPVPVRILDNVPTMPFWSHNER